MQRSPWVKKWPDCTPIPGTGIHSSGLTAIALATLLAGCASAPADPAQSAKPERMDLQVSALEAQGPLQLLFASPQRWLNFPMYQNDSAHAVDLGALRWRADSLLLSASRYPLHGGESWPKELYERAWYVYAKRLIDCRNGNDAELSEALLDRDGQVLLEQPAKSRPRMNREQRGESNRWLTSSEIGLACLAAAHPQLLSQRRAAAALPPPKLSYLPLSATLRDDVSMLRARVPFRVDESQLKAVSAQGASALLAHIGQQQAQWQRDLHGPAAKLSVQDQPWTSEIARQALEKSLNSSREELQFRALPRGEYQRWEDPRGLRQAPKPPAELDEAKASNAELIVLRQGSCVSNFSVITEYRWYVWRSSQLLAQRPATADEMAGSVQPVPELCTQLRMRSASLASDKAKPDSEREAAVDITRTQGRIEKLLQAEQTPEVRAQILLELRQAMQDAEAEQ